MIDAQGCGLCPLQSPTVTWTRLLAMLHHGNPDGAAVLVQVACDHQPIATIVPLTGDDVIGRFLAEVSFGFQSHDPVGTRPSGLLHQVNLRGPLPDRGVFNGAELRVRKDRKHGDRNALVRRKYSDKEKATSPATAEGAASTRSGKEVHHRDGCHTRHAHYLRGLSRTHQ